MPLNSLQHLLQISLYRARFLGMVIALLFILYTTVFLWFRIPYGGPDYDWDYEAQLIILNNETPPFLENDIVLQIGDQTPQRMRPVYSLPLQNNYDITVLRNDEILTFETQVLAPLNGDFIRLMLPATAVSFAGWLLGMIMLLLAQRQNLQALQIGYTFLLSAVVVIGIQGGLEGSPGAWAGGHVLVFPLAVAFAQLGLIPRAQDSSHSTKLVVKTAFFLAMVLSVLALLEVFILFPTQTSFVQLIGVSLYSLGVLLAALGLLITVITLIFRFFRLPRRSYLRQQIGILMLFVGIGIVPTLFLTVLPWALFQMPLLPFPIAILLMFFIPAGYLFVIHRKGFLGLDLFFSRLIYLVLLSLLVFCFYVGGLFLVQQWLNLPATEALIPALIVFFPTLLLTLYASTPVNNLIQQVVYGSVVKSQKVLAELALMLSAAPELSTLEELVTTVSDMLNIPQAILALQDTSGKIQPVVIHGEVTWRLPRDLQLDQLRKHHLRSSRLLAEETSMLFNTLPWAELILPVMVREETIGLFVLAKPGLNAHFNAQQVTFLTQAAGVLAVGSENVTLFEATRRLSRRLLGIQEEERRTIAGLIHDDPLQRISFAINMMDSHLLKIDQDAAETAVLQNVVDHLRSSAGTLREICVGLYPPSHDLGLTMTIQEIVLRFQKMYALDAIFEAPTKGDPHVIPVDVVSAIGQIITESLNNVLKHAPHAKTQIELHWQGDELQVQVIDNGPGNRLANLSISELTRRQHFGVVNMHESARKINGELKLLSPKTGGTIVSLTYPLLRSLQGKPA
jgi:signal transduction histidine kinase